MSTPVDRDELARNLRNKLASREGEVISPSEGRIVTGVVSTQDMSVRAGPQPVRVERPPLTPLEALFSDDDPEGCKYYTATTGVLNIPREDGTKIMFVRGVYKTADPEDIKMLDYMCRKNFAREVLPPSEEPQAKED